MSMVGHNQKKNSEIVSLNKEDLKVLKKAVLELNDSMLRVAAEKDLQKEILAKISEDLDIDKKILRKIANVYYKASFDTEQEEHRKFEDGYTAVTETVL